MSSYRQGTVLALALLSGVFPALANALASDTVDVSPRTAIASELQQTLRSLALDPGQRPANLDALLEFYRHRNYQPAWCDDTGLSPAASRWLLVLEDAEQEGLKLAALHRAAIQERRDALSHVALAELDLMLSDSFLQYARYLGQGQLSPAVADPDWHIPPPAVDPVALLEQAARSGRFNDSVNALKPSHTAYAKLRKALTDYLDIQVRGGWPVFSATGPVLKPGDSSTEIPALRKVLWMQGDLAGNALQETVYDARLERAVRRFQRRHGLGEDGVTGARTRAALAVPVEQRIEQIRLNLERWRWLPRDLGERYITVNTAAYELQVHEGDDVPLEMRVIVGRQSRPTPVFTEEMRYLIINPYWNVPPLIATHDLIPVQARNPGYFTRRGIRVLSSWQPGATELAAESIDWKPYANGRHLPYKLRQDPGPNNALGRIKFMLPNPYNIYLHDTPARELFDSPVRAYSSGCIRVEKPLELARYVLGSGVRDGQPALEALIAQGETRTVRFSDPVPVYTLYQTAWVNGNNAVQFREDIYRRDKGLLAAMQRDRKSGRNALFARNSPLINALAPGDKQVKSLEN